MFVLATILSFSLASIKSRNFFFFWEQKGRPAVVSRNTCTSVKTNAVSNKIVVRQIVASSLSRSIFLLSSQSHLSTHLCSKIPQLSRRWNTSFGIMSPTNGKVLRKVSLDFPSTQPLIFVLLSTRFFVHFRLCLVSRIYVSPADFHADSVLFFPSTAISRGERSKMRRGEK